MTGAAAAPAPAIAEGGEAAARSPTRKRSAPAAAAAAAAAEPAAPADKGGRGGGAEGAAAATSAKGAAGKAGAKAQAGGSAPITKFFKPLPKE